MMLDRWIADLEVLRREVICRIFGDRAIWREVVDEIQSKAPTAPATFRNHYTRLYIDSQVIALRRVVRAKAGKVSLLGLVREIARNPERVTRDRYVGFHPEDDLGLFRRNASDLFDERWGDGTGKADPTKLQAGVDQLARDLKAVLARADRLVAHIDVMNPPPTLTFGNLDTAIDKAGAAFQDVGLLLTGSFYVLEPTIQDNWTAVFRSPLFRVGRA